MILKDAESLEVLLQGLPIDVFGVNIRGVVNPRDLGELEILVSQAFLYPLVCGVEVPDLSQAPPPADTYGCRRIGENFHVKREGQVDGDALQAEAMAGFPAYAGEFSLTTG